MGVEQVPAVPSPQQQPITEKPKSNRVVGFMVVVVVLLAGAAGFLGYQNYLLQQKINKMVQPTPTPTATPDPTANWKTYTSQDYGFELRYPGDWEAKQATDGAGKPIGQFSWSAPRPSEKVEAYTLMLSVLNTNETTVDAFVQSYLAAGNPGKIEYKSKSDITVGGVTGFKLEGVFAFDKSQDQIYLLHNSKIYEFILPVKADNPNIANALENNPIAYQILSTFKFTDQTTESWKTYTNSVLGVSLKTPFKEPVESINSFQDYKNGAVTLTGKFIFDINSLKVCEGAGPYPNACIIPGRNWFQSKDIEPVILATKEAVSFFVSEPTVVMHVIQFQQPKVEFAMAVDGMGQEDIFNQILSTFKFTD